MSLSVSILFVLLIFLCFASRGHGRYDSPFVVNQQMHERSATSHQQPPPHVIFILADDYGFADVGYHGSAIRTPNLDKLADTGVRLENYYVQPICSPTRSQLLSGRYQIHTGLEHGIIWPCQKNSLPSDIPTIADKLKETGYSTHMIGKWHIGFYEKNLMPPFRGFDSYFGYLTGSKDYFTHIRCYDLNSQDNNTSNEGQEMNGGGEHVCGLDLRDGLLPARNYTGHYSTHVFAKKAVEIIDAHANEHIEKPLFMYLPFQAVHSPLQVPDEYIKPYMNIKNKMRRTYAGMVSCLDEAVGNITQELMKKGMWNNTILIFSTDNGGQVLEGGNNWPLRGWKGSLWDGGLRGVGFVHSPLIRQPGSINHGLFHVTDWFPTLLNLAGGSTTGLQLDGWDIWKSISEGKLSPRKELLHNIDILTPKRGSRLNITSFDNRQRASIRVGDWKLITGDPGNGSWIAPPEDSGSHSIIDTDPKEKNLWLFDLKNDPHETKDVFNENKDIATSLLERLIYYQSSAVPPRFPKDDPLCNPDLHEGVWSPWV